MENLRSPQQGKTTALKLFPYELISFFRKDPRHYQISFLTSFLIFGILKLGWEFNYLQVSAIFFTCLLTQLFFSKVSGQDLSSLKSALISSLSLCLILKTNFIITAVLAAFLSIAGKFFIRYKGKHIYNPTNFGIILTILLSGDAWISPGQWGSDAMLLFLTGSLGLLVLLKVKRLDTALIFLASFGVMQYIRTVVYLGWTMDVFIQQMTNGTLLLFTFFMITDPRSTPSSFPARLIWASGIGILAAYLQISHWVNGSPLWALFFLSPLTPILDKYFNSENFQWSSIQKRTDFSVNKTQYSIRCLRYGKVLALIFILAVLPGIANAFCGFYVAKADASLFNKSSQVILVRDGNQSVITMSSDYSGPLEDFAMVVPVPVVLKKSDIRIVERVLFDSFDAYSGPRLVEYWDENPCWERGIKEELMDIPTTTMKSVAAADAKMDDEKPRVKIEAKYVVGEYDILILSAEESTGLESWLKDNGYKIPSGAKGVLEPYIRSGMKFFVVKVNLEGYRKEGAELLRPLQITFESQKFMLPIRLGMANSIDSQDMIVYALTRNGRVETTNYRTVNMPTDRNVSEFVKDNFGKFYADTYKTLVKREGMKNVFLEYAWDVSGNNFVKCDPCAGNPPIYADLVNAGANWLRTDGSGRYSGSVYFTRLHVTYDREHFAQDLVFQETPNKQNFQSRYVLRHAAPGPFDCQAGKNYISEVRKRRYRELQELASLTGWDIRSYQDYLQQGIGAIPVNVQPVLPDPVQLKDTFSKTAIIPKVKPVIISGPSSTVDSISLDLSDAGQTTFKAQAAQEEGQTDYKVIFAMLGLAVLYFIERNRK